MMTFVCRALLLCLLFACGGAVLFGVACFLACGGCFLMIMGLG